MDAQLADELPRRDFVHLSYLRGSQLKILSWSG